MKEYIRWRLVYLLDFGQLMLIFIVVFLRMWIAYMLISVTLR